MKLFTAMVFTAMLCFRAETVLGQPSIYIPSQMLPAQTPGRIMSEEFKALIKHFESGINNANGNICEWFLLDLASGPDSFASKFINLRHKAALAAITINDRLGKSEKINFFNQIPAAHTLVGVPVLTYIAAGAAAGAVSLPFDALGFGMFLGELMLGEILDGQYGISVDKSAGGSEFLNPFAFLVQLKLFKFSVDKLICCRECRRYVIAGPRPLRIEAYCEEMTEFRRENGKVPSRLCQPDSQPQMPTSLDELIF